MTDNIDTPEDMRDLAEYCGTQAKAALKRYAELLEQHAALKARAGVLEENLADVFAYARAGDVDIVLMLIKEVKLREEDKKTPC